MKFTTPCFVRVKDAVEQAQLIEWLICIGYRSPYDIQFGDQVVATKHGIFRLSKTDDICRVYNAINCDTNIPLFKALAAMNDENDREQWFIVNVSAILFKQLEGYVYSESGKKYLACGEWFKPLSDNICFSFIGSRDPIRKATAEEIIEHFKNQKP